jgi:ABC-type sulfate transport system permease component
MARTAPRWLRTLAKFGAVLLIANEVRGLILAAPVLIALWNSGGTLMAIWLAFCSLAGIALSVAVPWWIARRIKAPA